MMTVDQSRPWLVMKFGGTSVGLADRMRQVVDIIRYISGQPPFLTRSRKSREQYRPIVVLSAMSSHRKTEGTTSRLLAAAEEVLKPHSNRHRHIVDDLEKDHLATAEAAVVDPAIRASLCEDLVKDFQRLRSFLEAAEVSCCRNRIFKVVV